MNKKYETTRSYPWSTVPSHKRVVKRKSRYYYLLTLHLRENPPEQKSFRIRELADRFGATRQAMYQTARNYHFDSKYFLARIPIPLEIKGNEKEWEWVIEQLHKTGFYFIQPLSYQSRWWGEPSFRQFEDYSTMHIREAFNRALLRLQDAEDFGLTLDGLDIRKELDYIKERKRLLMSPDEEE